MKQLLSFWAIVIMTVTTGLAQQLPITNQYILNAYALNPAFAGENGNIEAFLGYRASWLGVEGAPKMSHVNLNAAIGETMGLGLAIQSESAGSFEHIYGNISYAYHLKLNDDMYASLGLEAMLYRNQIDNSKVLSQGLDPLLANAAALSGTTYDAGAGAAFWMKNLTFGVAAKRLIGSRISYEGDEQSFFYAPGMHINSFLSYSIPVGKVGGRARSRRASKQPKYRIEPMAVVHYTGGSVFYDAVVNAMFKDRVWAGAMYRTDGSIGLHLGGALQERIIMNYSYEFGMGQKIASQSSGTHEITIGFLLKAPKVKRGRSLFLLDAPVGRSQPTIDPKIEQKLTAVTDSLKAYVKRTDPRIAKLEEEIKFLKQTADVKKEDTDASKYGAAFVLKNIRFSYNSYRLLPSSYGELNKIYYTMKKNSKWEILITGHTDDLGSKVYNKRLSGKRAKAVADYLVRKGIQKNRIKTEGKGSESPVDRAKTASARAKNRRIEGAYKKNEK